MATVNPFDLLDDDAEDPSLFIAAHQLKPVVPVAGSATKKGPVQPAKPVPPTQAVREARSDGQRGGRGGPRGGGRGSGRGFDQESAADENAFGSNNGFSGGRYRAPEDGESGKVSERRGGYSGPRGGFRGGRRGGNNGDAAEGEGERPRRVFDRRSGTSRGNEFIKREGSGRGNWGTPADDIAPETEEPVNDGEKIVEAEKQAGQEDAGDTTKDSAAAEPEEKQPEEKEMTLEEYEKVMEEKRKALLALKQEERKVNLDKELESMQLLSNKKKNDDEIFIKLGSDKDKKKEAVEKAKKTKSINEFLKPAEGESYYRPGGRGKGQGRGRGGGGGDGRNNNISAPAIENVAQFPSLFAK